MADKRIVDLPTLANLADGDLIEGVDVSDATDDPSGSSVSIALSTVKSWIRTAFDLVYAPFAHVDDNSHVPIGGLTGQVLAKNSNTDRDTVWQTPAAGGGGGGAAPIGDWLYSGVEAPPPTSMTSGTMSSSIGITDGSSFDLYISTLDAGARDVSLYLDSLEIGSVVRFAQIDDSSTNYFFGLLTARTTGTSMRTLSLSSVAVEGVIAATETFNMWGETGPTNAVVQAGAGADNQLAVWDNWTNRALRGGPALTSLALIDQVQEFTPQQTFSGVVVINDLVQLNEGLVKEGELRAVSSEVQLRATSDGVALDGQAGLFGNRVMLWGETGVVTGHNTITLPGQGQGTINCFGVYIQDVEVYHPGNEPAHDSTTGLDASVYHVPAGGAATQGLGKVDGTDRNVTWLDFVETKQEVAGDQPINNVRRMTQSQYDSGPKNADTLYVIVG